LNSAVALSQGDVKGAKGAWREYPKEFVSMYAVFSTLGLMNYAKAGMTGALETDLVKRHGYSKEQAAEWSNRLMYNAQSSKALSVEIAEREGKTPLTDAKIEKALEQMSDQVERPAYADVIRHFHQGDTRPVEETQAQLDAATSRGEAPLAQARMAEDVFTPKERAEATSTSRAAGAIGEKALVPRQVSANVLKGDTVLNYGAGKVNKQGRIRHSDTIEGAGGRVTNYDFPENATKGIHDPAALGRQYDTVMASNVLNVQASESMLRRTVGEINKTVKRDGKAIVNYPLTPRKSNVSVANLQGILKEYFSGVEVIGGIKSAPVFRLTKPIIGKSVLSVPVPPIDRPRYIAGEKHNKTMVQDRLNLLPEVSALPRGQRKILSEAIDKFDGPIEDLTPTKLGEIVRAIKFSRPLKDAEAIGALEDKQLNSYIAGTLYKNKKTGKKGYLADMKALGFKGKGLTDKKLTRDQKIALAIHGTKNYQGRLPTKDTAAELKGNTELVNALRETINDIKGTELLPQGPGLTGKERTVLYDYLSDGKWIKRKDPDGSLRNEFIDSVEYSLPRDSASLRESLGQYELELHAKIVAGEQIQTAESRGTVQKLFNAAKNYASRKLMIDKIARDTGNYKLFAVEQMRQANKKEANLKGNQLIDDVFEKTGVDKNIASYTSDKPKIEEAVKYVMGIDPNTHYPKMKAAREQALELIKNDSRGEEIIKLSDGLREVLGGESGVNVRILKTKQFGEKWDSNKRAYKVLSAMSKKEITDTQKKQLSKITRELNEGLPVSFNKKTGKAERVSVDEMAKAWDVYKKRNDKATREYLSKQDWGTRDYYYMSTKHIDAKTLVNPRKAEELPSLRETEIKTGVKPTGRIEQRTGDPEFAEGSPWGAIRRHVANLYAQAYTLDASRYVARATDAAANKGFISKEAANSLNKALLEDIGQAGERVKTGASIMYRVTRSWWTAFGLMPAKMAWYTARNMLYQGVPWGAINGQYRAVDVAKAGALSVETFKNKDSFPMRHLREDFDARIKVGKQLYFEGFLQFAHSERTKIPNKITGKAQEIASLMFAFSDNWNRRYSTFTGDIIIDGYVDKYITGNISEAQLLRGLKVKMMPEGHRRYLTDLFNKARSGKKDGNGIPLKENFNEFMRQTSELKTLMINYPYQVSERSALEQGSSLRWLYGIPVYSRGSFEAINETVARPLAETWNRYAKSGYKMDKFDYRTASDAIGNLTGQMVFRAIAAAALGSLIGEKEEFYNALTGRKRKGQKITSSAYSLGNSIFSYGLLGPGSSDVIKMIGTATSLAKALFAGDTDTALKLFYALGNTALYYTVIIPELVPVLEAMGNKQGMKNLDVIRSAIKGKIIGGQWKDRKTTTAAILHALFDTEPMNRDSDVHKVYKMLKDADVKKEPQPKW